MKITASVMPSVVVTSARAAALFAREALTASVLLDLWTSEKSSGLHFIAARETARERFGRGCRRHKLQVGIVAAGAAGARVFSLRTSRG